MKESRQKDYQKRLKEQKGSKRGRQILTALLLVLVLAIAASFGWYMLSGQGAKMRYAERMQEGNRYLIQLDYPAAEIAYRKAIEEAPEEPEAYEKLANVYIAQNRYAEAGELLVHGIRRTNAEVLVKTYQRVSSILLNLQNGLDADGMTSDQILRVSDGLTLDATIYDMIASYTYRDYVRVYGEPVSAVSNSYGGKDIRFDGFSGNVSFRRASYAESRADVVSFDDLSELLGNYGGAASADKLQELFGSEMELTATESDSASGIGYDAVYRYHGCLVTLACDENGNVYGNAANTVAPDTEAEKEEDGQKNTFGYVINAVNGGGVSASIRFLKGGRYGTVERETAAQSDGSFAASLPPGEYTAEIRATGFITSYEELIVNEGTELRGLSFAVSPELESGEIRIVLTWGANPRDLDSHLEGTGSGGENVNISFQNMTVEHTANLDIDDTSGYGPETTTIYDADGSYTFKIHNYSAGYDSARLDQSGAVVKVYLSGQSDPMVFQVPSGDGIWWDVCRIENGQVTSINTIY
ncbi:MAG: hypothetical protein KH452_01530 [Clostridiales bacterium]|nr:hypothetical protein [Clostridiales bacterium]